MNIPECDILYILSQNPYTSQRNLSKISGYSPKMVKRSIQSLTDKGFLNDQKQLTANSFSDFSQNSPKNAVILAAGFGMRMVPINMETPKGLLEVQGEPLIERLIKQLHEVGIREIYVVVGYMKERYEYLIDEYGVQLIINPAYSAKNNLHSLLMVLPHLSNTYILPCDIWCRVNPFRKAELHSWYMVTDAYDENSPVRVDRNMNLVKKSPKNFGNSMIGIAYLCGSDTETVRNRIGAFAQDSRHDTSFWEEVLYTRSRMIISARVVSAADAIEINTYEHLRELDNRSINLKSEALQIISQALAVPEEQVTEITVLKKGMTNRSFSFRVNEKRYIMRIPGEGTDALINRKEEAAVYARIQDKKICDEIVYINPENGYKISEMIERVRVCNPMNPEDLKKCMERLRSFHNLGLTVDHFFDIFHQITYYESLWNGMPSVYRDYEKTKENIFKLKPYIEAHRDRIVLTHIDAVPDNFLFEENGEVRLIDWEYAGMQDPHVDIAMFCIYSLYDRKQIDALIDLYFENTCANADRIKIYCYIAACGLLWSNWCEYKRNLGVEFSEYAIRQYRYAKEYYRIVKDALQQKEC